MKITKIERDENHSEIFLVTFTPNIIENWVGIKSKTEKFKDIGSVYLFGNGTVYINQLGDKIGNGNRIGVAIDKWRRAF